MSRAFRDTFKQTFCVCKKETRRTSNITFAQAAPKRINHQQSIVYETVSTQKTSEDYRTSLTENGAKKKRTLTFFQRSID